MSSGGRAIGNSDSDRKPELRALTVVLKNRVQTPIVVARARIRSPPSLT